MEFWVGSLPGNAELLTTAENCVYHLLKLSFKVKADE